MSQNSCLDLCEVPFQFLEWSFRLFQHMFVSLLIRHQFGQLINFFGVYWCSTCCHESPFSFFTAIMYRGNISTLLQLWELENVLNIIQIIVLLYHSIGYMSRKILITKLTSLVFRLTILKCRLKIFLCWLFNLLDQHTWNHIACSRPQNSTWSLVVVTFSNRFALRSEATRLGLLCKTHKYSDKERV